MPATEATVRVTDGIHELSGDVITHAGDMRPTTLAERKWGTWDMAALWVSMSACIPSYQLASGAINQGMNWWQAVMTVVLGNLIVLVPMVLNAHAGTAYGIPFPVYCRAAFGRLGANVPAMLRALVACGWFGIQCWIGGQSLLLMADILRPGLRDAANISEALPMSWPAMICFLLFWLMNMAIIWKGINAIRWFMNTQAPILIAVPILLAIWAVWKVGSIGPIFSQESQFVAGGAKEGQFWSVFLPNLTAAVGFWSTLALNIPDFSRFAKSQRSQVVGQIVGMPTTMGLYAFIGVLVTAATVVLYSKPEWDPIKVIGKFAADMGGVTKALVILVAMFSLLVATLSTNIAANLVGPANDFAHLLPSKITFRMGGLITGLIGIAMQPWRLMADPSGYVFTWLVAYSSLLGAVAGILIGDYFIIRRKKLDLAGLYMANGPYTYLGGVNPIALIALLAGILPCAPGYLSTIQVKWCILPPDSIWVQIYNFAWFVSLGVAMVTHVVLMQVTGWARRTQASANA